VDVREAALRWAHTWTTAWETEDAEAIVACQAEDGVHWSSPFRAPHRGRAGLRKYLQDDVFGDEMEPTRARFAEPVVQGDQATVEYWALSRYDSGPLTISGCTVLQFDPDGLVIESRDYSFVEPGHHQAPFQMVKLNP
jgi:ketosteroid isomerase-like protein